MMEKLINTLPQWMSSYVTQSLTDLGVQVRMSTRIEEISDDEVNLSNGERFKRTGCIWTTGLESSSLSRTINVNKAKKGRIIVDKNLFFKENCLAAGDAACCMINNQCSRMSVQCSIDQGRTAAFNAIANMRKVPLKKYKLWDPGFIIPLSNGKACGEIFGISVKGSTALILHYLLSTYRASGMSNKFSIAHAALKAV